MPPRALALPTRAHARAAVVGAALCAAVAMLPGVPATAAGTAGPGSGPSPGSGAGRYAFAEGARPVAARTSTTDAERLTPGTSYTSSLPGTGKVYYRLELDDTSNAYVAATAVPRAGRTVTAGDGIRVSVQDADGNSCSFDSATVGPSRSPHPVTAVGTRETRTTRVLCQAGGTYYLVVERITGTDSSPGTWDLELSPVLEPRLRQATATSAPETWNSASAQPLPGDPRRCRGGLGFASATPLTEGVWRDDIRPGQTLFYAVPLGWGRQPYATVELGNSSGGKGFVPGALNVSLHNPVRAEIENTGVTYDGNQRSATLQPVPPVSYPNRYAVADRVNTMRFAGSYYLVVNLSAQVADRFGDAPVGLTLRVRIKGGTLSGPGYDGPAEPAGIFGDTARDGQTAAGNGASGGDATMRLVAAGGIGAGTVLLVALGAWTALARRRPGER
ncbi:hypothetical protein ABZT03_01075 [Streptomyces sp. NPDC005574]|uniref:hypothetical protein n=1 Tax=Streptomyces sp. NPDC005574 TaxID=3156891 RepID=UPI0033BE4C47